MTSARARYRFPTVCAHLLSTALLLSGLLLSSGVHADTVVIPVGQQDGSQAIDKPSLGMTMDTVQQRFGEPERRSGPTGNPPISRWDYRDFSVYFEYQTVIHSVTHFQPKSEG